jgi:hypothetical protein
MNDGSISFLKKKEKTTNNYDNQVCHEYHHTCITEVGCDYFELMLMTKT